MERREITRKCEILGQTTHALALRVRENWEILTGSTLLTTLSLGTTLVIVGDDRWKNIGALITIETMIAPICILLAAKLSQREKRHRNQP